MSMLQASQLRGLFGMPDLDHGRLGAFRASSNFSYSSGSTAVTSFQVTVPAGVVSTDTLYIICGTATNSGTAHTAPGATADPNLNGVSLGTSGKATLLELTGLAAGAQFFVTNNASGLSGALMVAYDNTTTRDAWGTAAATGTAQTSVAPTLNTTEANELTISVAVFLDNAANSISSVSTGTIRASSTAGGNIRWWGFAFSDRTVASVGASGTVTWTANAGSQLGSTSTQITHKAAVVGGGGSTARKVEQGGAIVTGTRKVMQSGALVTATRTVKQAGSLV